MMKTIERVSLFKILYVLVAFATFRHSAFGFATIESGGLFWGALSALAVDAGMALSASGLQRQRNRALVLGLAVSALASTYTQLLYSIEHAQAVTVAPGALWLGGVALTLARLRVLALPALLPLLSVVYAFASKSTVTTSQSRTIEDIAAEIRGQTDNKGERAARLWAHSNNGFGELPVTRVAELAGCSESTARDARRAGE